MISTENDSTPTRHQPWVSEPCSRRRSSNRMQLPDAGADLRRALFPQITSFAHLVDRWASLRPLVMTAIRLE
ncbi:hypothetical protein KRMM14A1004_50950 [Krasilnikovia sp. MM14-A1004]